MCLRLGGVHALWASLLNVTEPQIQTLVKIAETFDVVVAYGPLLGSRRDIL
jgi:hypothetical protein